MQRPEDIDRVLEALEQTGLSVSSFLISLVSLERYENHRAIIHLMSHGPELLIALRKFLNKNVRGVPPSTSVASEIMMETYAQEIRHASAGENGSHFNVSHTSLNQLEEFSVNNLATQMEQCAPQFWRLLDVLLDARHRRRALDEDGDQTMEPGLESEDDEAYWSELGDAELEGAATVPGGLAKDAKTVAALRRNALHHALTKVVGYLPCGMASLRTTDSILTIQKKVVIFSILMQSTNRKSNCLQSLMGIFLQSTHTPQKVIETLA